MTNKIMLRAHADENTVQFRTVSAHMKSPQRFYITYGELDRLQRDDHIITNDIHSFARLWLDERATGSRSTSPGSPGAASTLTTFSSIFWGC